MNSLLSLDQSITLFFKNLIPHNVFFDYFFSFFSLKGSSILIWILIIIGVAILEEKKYPGISKKDKKFLLLFSVSFLLTIFISTVFLKNIFHRIRPSGLFSPFNPYSLLSSCPKDFSFPSTHAATAFAAATILAFFDKKRKWFYFIIAVLISFSRIYLGCHYLLDVIVGCFIGWIISKIILRIYYKQPDRLED